MTSINLLPWREKRRTQNKRQLLTMILAAAIFALFINFIWYLLLQPSINHQQRRNNFLQQQIQAANAVLAQKQSFEQKKKEVVDQMKTLEQLHNQRYRIVELLDSLPKILPNSVFVNAIEVQNTAISLTGEAPTDIQVSEFVRALNKQTGWRNVQLQEITSAPNQHDVTLFRITFSMD